MNIKTISLFCIVMMLLLPINSYVRAEVVEQTRVLYIAPSDVVNYTSVLNIVNETNNQYTNYERLVLPFIDNTSISGGYSGSFLPPSKFQLEDAKNSNINNHLILASFVEFQRKNLLSGASVSWWRCPYFYNSSTIISNNWALNLSIYHVDLPRQVNISWELATGTNNYPPVPTDSAHPSLIFQREYINCGQTQNDKQWNISTSFTIPANDTLVNSDLPLNLNVSSGDYNPYKYNVSLDFSFAWFNVTAPIYPNETYMVVWDIIDVDTNDAGSCWITATDIGDNGYGRSLISWNSQDIYEMPIDLDTSVIFQYGLGAGVSGQKLLYNNPNVQDHTSLFDNPSFEIATFHYEEDFSNEVLYNNYVKSVSSSTFAWIRRNADAEQVEFIVNRSGYFSGGGSGSGVDTCNNGQWAELYYDFSPTHFSPEGSTFRFDITMNDGILESAFGTWRIEGSSVKLALMDTNAQQGWIVIERYKWIDGSGVTIDNRLLWLDPTYTMVNTYPLPETLPNNLFITLQCGLAFGGNNYIHIYDQSAPNYVYFSHELTNNYRSGHALHPTINSVVVSAVANGGVLHSDEPLLYTNTPVLILRTISGVERTRTLGNWAVGGGWVESPSKHDFFGGFETVVPDYAEQPSTPNTKAFGFIQESSTVTSGYISQYSSITALSNRQYFASINVRLMPDSLTESTSNSYFRLKLHGYDGTWHSSTSYFRVWDGAWHTVSSNYLTGSFVQFFVECFFYFEGATVPDHKIGMVDNFKLVSIDNSDRQYHLFEKKIDKAEWDSQNYYTFMMPFMYSNDPDFAPLCTLEFKNNTGTILNTYYTSPYDFYGDFILYSIKTSEINTQATYVTIKLFNFGSESYIFLFDKNNQFIINNKFETKFNKIEDYDASDTLLSEHFISPYYSLRTTEGQWVNADSLFTTVYFYYVVVHFVEFKDNDPQVISIRYDTVDVKDYEVYRENLKSFGEVFTAREWAVYLDIRNRPSFSDRIWDTLCDFAEWLWENGLGAIISPIGFLLWQLLNFLAPLLESLINYIIDVLQFVIAVFIFIFGVWVMWKFVLIWVMIGEGRTEEGIAIADDTSKQVIDKVKSAVRTVVGGITKIFTGGAV